MRIIIAILFFTLQIFSSAANSSETDIAVCNAYYNVEDRDKCCIELGVPTNECGFDRPSKQIADNHHDSTQRKTSNLSTHWYSGGNLHNATVAEWRDASYSNKLATAGDWLASTKWKGHLITPADFDRLKQKAIMLVNAVNEASTPDKKGIIKANEIAAAIITMSNDLGP